MPAQIPADYLCPGYTARTDEVSCPASPISLPSEDKAYFGLSPTSHISAPLKLPERLALSGMRHSQRVSTPTYISRVQFNDWSPPAHTGCRMANMQSIAPFSAFDPEQQVDKETSRSLRRFLPSWKKKKGSTQKKSFKLSLGDKTKPTASSLCHLVTIAVVGTLALVNLLVLDIKVLPAFTADESLVTVSASTAGQATSANFATCLSLFDLTADNAPKSYPCNTCVPVMTGFRGKGSDGLNKIRALQFCALADVYTATEAGQTQNVSNSLDNAGWMANADICSWSGIACDGQRLVTGLNLQAPSIPTSLPTTLVLLQNLVSLDMVGDSNSPSGDLPDLRTFPALQSVSITDTGLNGRLPDDMFVQLPRLQSFQIVGNGNISNALPVSITFASLKSLTISDQNINPNSLVTIADSKTLEKTLASLTLSHCGLTGTQPDLSAFHNLKVIDLTANAFD